MLAIRVPEDSEKRLEALAKRTGRTKTYISPRPVLRRCAAGMSGRCPSTK